MKKYGKIGRAAGVLSLILFMVLVLLQLAVSVFSGRELPVLFGYSYLAVLSGSMEPAISAGDLLVISRQTDYGEGDIITFSEDGFLTTHRIMALEEGGYDTKGDANTIRDINPVPAEQVLGKVVGIIPKAGKLLLAVRSPLVIAIVFLAGAAVWLLTDKKKTGEKGACG